MATQKEQIIHAIIAYRNERGITGDDLIQVADPTDEKWHEWTEQAGMTGDPDTAQIALQVEGYGAFYNSVEAAIEDLPIYFMEPDE